jgi:signal transduction histidine kinase
MRKLLDMCIEQVRSRYRHVPAIKVVLPQELPAASLDVEQVGVAIIELLRNAVESEGCTQIECRIEIEREDDRLTVRIVDDGSGLSPHALAHAFDPFFSAKPAGRQPGLGLAQARRIIEAHGGQITLENGPARGAVAVIRLPHWRAVPAPVETLRDVA